MLTFVVKSNLNGDSRVDYSEELNPFSHDHLKFDDPKEQKAILNIKLHKTRNEKKKLILMTQNRVIAVPMDFCGLRASRLQCDNQLYPYCIWSNSECVQFGPNFVNETVTEDLPRVVVNPTTVLSIIDNLNSTINSTINNTLSVNYTSIPLVSLDRGVMRTYKLNVVDNDLQFTMNLFTYVFTMFSFVIISFALGAILTVLLIRTSKHHRIFHFDRKSFLELFTKKRQLLKKSHIDEEKEIDKFENLYSKVIKPKNRALKVSEKSKEMESLQAQPSHYSAISDTHVQQQPSEPIYSRYVCLNSMDTPYLNNIDLPLNSQFFVNNSRFVDYDDSEYFTIKKARFKQGLRNSSSESSSVSDSSGQTLNSMAMLVKQPTTENVVKNTKNTKSPFYDQSIYSIVTNNSKKYYI